MSPLVSGHCAVLASLVVVLGFALLALAALLVAGYQRWRLGSRLLALCCGDEATAWAELREIHEKNVEDERRLRAAMETAFDDRSGK